MANPDLRDKNKQNDDDNVLNRPDTRKAEDNVNVDDKTKAQGRADKPASTDSPDRLALFNANDTVAGRAPGKYLDEVANAQAELERAAVEGRDPEAVPSASYAGIQLLQARHLPVTSQGSDLPGPVIARSYIPAEHAWPAVEQAVKGDDPDHEKG